MQRMGRARQIAARKLMFTLRARLDACHLVFNCKVDGGVIAEFEMQTVVVFRTAPVPSKKRIAPNEI